MNRYAVSLEGLSPIVSIGSALGLWLVLMTAGDRPSPDHAPAAEAKIDWKAQLQRVDDALARDDVAAAEVAWRDAYAAALKSRRWEGMAAVGDASRRLGERQEFGKVSPAKAREAYLTALFRARAEGSLDGVLLVAERFADLGDHDVVEQCFGVARSVAARSRDPRAEARVQVLAERWAARAREAEQQGFVP